MFKLKKPEIYASEIAEFINTKLFGLDFIVREPAFISHIKENTFSFLQTEDNINNINIPNESLVICLSSLTLNLNCSYIFSKNPKLDFIRVINEFFVEIESYKISKSAIIHPNAIIAQNVSIGEHCVIGQDTVIGDNTQILNNVVIGGRVEIGNNCIIKDNSTIGSEGYEFVIDEDGFPIHYPHIGKIIIGNNVWIGSNSTIESAAINDTLIMNHVKIDDLVQIGSGCTIENGCMVTAGSILSQNVVIKKDSWLSPNVTIIENIIVGKNCVIGAGSVVLKDVAEYTIVVGNPARFLRNTKNNHNKKN
jgi:UDP-3-O-[3-hydroxymyristoyl] glucosamine N-acyltransferase